MIYNTYKRIYRNTPSLKWKYVNGEDKQEKVPNVCLPDADYANKHRKNR